ncbi:sensor domain-containing diguanylate cyclase [Polynucleobacter sp. UK-Kesae-W10]|uniref:bifunctional diguanylate cyclase/phosphodiesterase n=1 Tax=Polynucleobacter sp. UK-Kesae-W10 TaxID=1819738 RepID=UPI001C0CBC6B|nr:sensor domain-containing diguanylate cyclase [Polynucleobacter sp. UK-Kesae-W10]MBU3577840.1 GGDEF domain-containing protein [Polynucleobacter sp. UK-Kesae-W10]
MPISFEPSSNVRRNSRIIIGASIVLAFIFVINAVISGYLLRRNTIEDRADQLATLTLILAEHTSQVILSANTVLNSIDDLVYAAKIEDEKSYRKFTSNKNQFELLEEKTKSNSILDVTTFVANDGKVLNFSRSYPAPEINLADRDYFIYLKSHNSLETYYSAPVQNKGNGKWVFYLARRVNGAHDEFLGLILVGVSVEVFSSLYERLGSSLGDGSAITLYREDKTLLTRWPLVEKLIGRVNNNNLIEESLAAASKGNGVIFASRTGFTRQNTEPVERMISYRKVAGYPFIVGAVVPETLYLANWHKNATGGLIATILSIIILFVGTYFLLKTYRRNAENQYRAHHDVLTKLPNRTLFSDRLSHALAACKRNQSQLALLFIDLDNLKTINDVNGHHAGDAVLTEVASRMRACLRDTDTVARLGGDEFIVLLPGVGEEKTAMMIAEKIRSALAAPIMADGGLVSTSASIGVAIYPDHGLNESDLMNNADVAMYEAKSNGRNAIQIFGEGVVKSIFKDIS